MKLSLGLPTQRVDQSAEFVTGEAIAAISRAAEAAGFDAVYVTEHPIPEKRWKDTGGHHALDPFVALSELWGGLVHREQRGPVADGSGVTGRG